MLLSLSLCLSLNSGRRQTDILYVGHRRLPQESGFSRIAAYLHCTDFLWKADISLYSMPARAADVGVACALRTFSGMQSSQAEQ